MENAAQALLITGGILIAILTISLLIVMFNNLSIMGNAQADKAEIEQLTSWNREWEAYNKNFLYGADVLTVINKAEEASEVEIEVYFGKELADKNFVQNYRTAIFKCIDVEYNKAGKLNKMKFEYVE